MHPSEVFPRPALILLGGELAALLEGSLVDHALGGGAPRVLLRPEPRLLVHQLAHREQGIGSAAGDSVDDDGQRVSSGVHRLQRRLPRGVLLGASCRLLLLERGRLRVPRLATFEFLRPAKLLLRGDGVHLAFELGAAGGFPLLGGFDLSLRAGDVRGGELAPLVLAAHVGVLLGLAEVHGVGHRGLGGRERVGDGLDERLEALHLVGGGSAALLLLRADALLLLLHAADVSLGGGAPRVLLAAADGLVLPLRAHLGLVLRSPGVLLLPLRRLLVRHGKHRHVEHGRELPRPDRDRPVAQQRAGLVLGAQLVGGVIRHLARVSRRSNRVPRRSRRVHRVSSGGIGAAAARRHDLLNGVRDAPRRRRVAREPLLDVGHVLLQLALEKRASLGEVALNLRRRELSLRDEQVHLHHLVANLDHGHDVPVLDVALEHDLALLGERAEVVLGVGARLHRGEERALYASCGGAIKLDDGVVVDVVAVGIRRLRATVAEARRVDDELVLGRLGLLDEKRRALRGLRGGLLGGDRRRRLRLDGLGGARLDG